MTDRPIGRDPVRPRQNAADHRGDAGRVGAHIGALVVPELVIKREDDAVGIDSGADAVALLARVIGADEMLAPVLDPLDRPPEPHGGDAHQHILRIELAAHPEAAAHMRFMDVNR